jgi:2-haloalkanoic acid dehalogenase type II
VAPRLLTFDIFGTVLDWRRGLRDALAVSGVSLDDASFERVIDAQALEESGPFRSYAGIVASSLERVLGVDPAIAARVGRDAGTWPLYPDSRDALERLMKVAPCAATTNSDREHGRQVLASLGFPLSGWICAEDVGAYKPDPRIWRAASERLRVPFDSDWWHVSAYADYDLATSRSLGLTSVFVERPHARLGPADLRVPDLAALADHLERGSAPITVP